MIDATEVKVKLHGEDLYYTNFTYEPACYYFFYIGELKAYGLNQFVREALQKNFSNREVRFVAIIPDYAPNTMSPMLSSSIPSAKPALYCGQAVAWPRTNS